MTNLSLTDFVAVPLSARLYQEIAARFPHGVSGLIEDVVRDFLDRTSEDAAKRTTNRGNGIYWDQLFLPDKTRLRTKYFGSYQHAEIRGDEILYAGKLVPSVSQLARRMRNNTSVNAWLYIEVMRPGDAAWLKADVLRKLR